MLMDGQTDRRQTRQYNGRVIYIKPCMGAFLLFLDYPTCLQTILVHVLFNLDLLNILRPPFCTHNSLLAKLGQNPNQAGPTKTGSFILPPPPPHSTRRRFKA